MPRLFTSLLKPLIRSTIQYRSSLRRSTSFTYKRPLRIEATTQPQENGMREDVTVYSSDNATSITLRLAKDTSVWQEATCRRTTTDLTVMSSRQVAIPGLSQKVWYVEGCTPPRKKGGGYGVFFGLSNYKPWFGTRGTTKGCILPLYMGVSDIRQNAPYEQLFSFGSWNANSLFVSKKEVSQFFKSPEYQELRSAILSLRY